MTTITRQLAIPMSAVGLFLAVAVARGEDPSKQAGAPQKVNSAAIEFFETKVRPVLADRCFECHNADDPESKLSLDSLAGMLRGGELGPAIVPGKPEKSLLISAINHGEALKMPQKKKLSTSDIAAITRWVKLGAPWPGQLPITPDPRKSAAATLAVPEFTKQQREFWAFQPPVRPQLPKVKKQEWVRSPIDAFVLSRLEAAGLGTAAPADRRTLIRRATFDLTGLPPTPEEVEAFLADQSPAAFAKVIDRLLASPRYGERWGRHWLDVARYADSNGLDENMAYINAHHYRDYVIEALNDDKPFDRFVREQIAGDLLPASDDRRAERHRLVATGFLALGAKMLAEDDQIKMRIDIVDEQIRTICNAMMGMTMGCARCHDHKFDPLSMADYYALAGILKSTKTMENYKVVAKWYERPIRPPGKQHQAYARQLADLRRQVESAREQAKHALLANYRRSASKYMLAATELILHSPTIIVDGKKSLGESIKASDLVGRGAILEAEKYHRGNVVRDTSQYGKGIGVIYNAGPVPNFAEFDVTLPVAGKYQVELRYAAAEARPMHLQVNGRTVRSDAACKITGGWFPAQQKWFVEGVYEFQQGKNVIRLTRPSGPICHIDKILLVSTGTDKSAGDEKTGRTLQQLADHYQINAEMISLWQDALLQVQRGKRRDPLLAMWWEYAKLKEDAFRAGAKTLSQRYGSVKKESDRLPVRLVRAITTPPVESLTDLAGRVQRLVDQADQQTPADDLQRLLRDAKSPFARLPAKPLKHISKDHAQRIAALNGQIAALERSRPRNFSAMGVTENKISDARIHLRGSHVTLGAQAPRVFPRVMAGNKQTPIDKKQSGRLQLAQWLTRPDHPLTSRVLVNRIWRWHFGTGLVRTPDNFGHLGERPTHPLLLDWLARKMVDDGWSIKSMHRRMMLSNVYQMSTRYDPTADKADPENRLYWRFNRRRLDAEEIRDAIVTMGTGLDLAMGGTMLTAKPREYVFGASNSLKAAYKSRRRSVYLPVIRSSLYDVFQAFDFADPSMLSGNRASTTVAPQALFMMNSELVHEQSLAMAKRLLAHDDLDDSGRVRRAYMTAYARPATSEDCERALRGIMRLEQLDTVKNLNPEMRRQSAWQSWCRVIIASSPFVYVE